MEITHQLVPKWKQLRLSGVLTTLEARHRQAIDGQWADVECLERWREDESERRAQKPRARRGRRAALHTTSPLEGFDGRCNPPINRQQVLHLARDKAVEYRDRLAEGGWFDALTLSEEDRLRAASYKAEAARTIRDNFIQPTVNALGYSLDRLTLRWAAPPT